MLTKCRDSNPPLGGVLYAGGSYTKGGSYMPVDTVELVPTSHCGITIGYIIMAFISFAPGSLYAQQLAKHSWRWVCMFVGVIAAATIVILAIFYNPLPCPNAASLTKQQTLVRIDYLKGFLSIPSVVIFLVGLNWGRQQTG